MSRERTALHAAVVLFALCSGLPSTAQVADSAARTASRDSTGSVLVVVRDTGGYEVPLASVVILGRRRGGMTDEIGKALIRDLAPGAVRVRAQIVGYGTRVDSVVVRAGETDTLRFVLESVRGENCWLRASDVFFAVWDESDCNHNEIPDSLDIASGCEDDLNGNGQIDVCETEPVEGGWDTRGVEWLAKRPGADSLTLFRTFLRNWGVGMQCYVPEGMAPARLVVRGASRREILVVQERIAAGAHLIYWPFTDRRGRQVPSGRTYYVSLESRGSRVSRATRWAHRIPEFSLRSLGR